MTSYSRPPKCYLCSYKQYAPEKPVTVYHRHRSARQVRSLQGAEYANYNCTYMCPTCQTTHVAQLPYGLDVCVSTSQLHEFYQPREMGVVCPPDTSHVDWLTIPGAKVEDLRLAWRVDYSKNTKPMRILLVAGLNDLAKGGTFDTLTAEIKRFNEVVKQQGREFHPGMNNSFAVAPLIPAPKFVWFPDNGPTPPGYTNRREEIEQINEWIKGFNRDNNISQVPGFHTWGTRTTKRMVDGERVEFKTHRWNEWRASEAAGDKLHLVDKMRVKMAQYVVKYFQGQRKTIGPLLPFEMQGFHQMFR